MILVAAVLIFLGAFLLLWWAFGREEELRIEDDDRYVITSLYGFRKDRD